MSWLSCPGCYVLAVAVMSWLSWLFFLAVPSWKSFRGCPVQAILPGCPGLAILFWLSFSGISVLGILSWLYFAGSPIMLFFFLAFLSRLSFPGCPALVSFCLQVLDKGEKLKPKSNRISESAPSSPISEFPISCSVRYRSSWISD
jgi:hypothetical protein